MKLENWSVRMVAPDDSGFRAPEQCVAVVAVVAGKVYGHYKRFDGQAIQTSAIKNLDPSLTFVETRNSVYELGVPDPEWVKWLEANGYKLADYVKLYQVVKQGPIV